MVEHHRADSIHSIAESEIEHSNGQLAEISDGDEDTFLIPKYDELYKDKLRGGSAPDKCVAICVTCDHSKYRSGFIWLCVSIVTILLGFTVAILTELHIDMFVAHHPCSGICVAKHQYGYRFGNWQNQCQGSGCCPHLSLMVGFGCSKGITTPAKHFELLSNLIIGFGIAAVVLVAMFSWATRGYQDKWNIFCWPPRKPLPLADEEQGRLRRAVHRQQSDHSLTSGHCPEVDGLQPASFSDTN